MNLRAFICALLAISAAGCGAGFHPNRHAVPGPAGALAAAPLGNDLIAILAGNDDLKTVSLVSLSSGALIRTFGVTRETSDLSAAGPDGPLLLTIAARRSDGEPTGAVELWTLDGAKQAVVAMPMQAVGITRAIGSVAYVLIQAGKVRAAVPVNVATRAVGRAIALDAYSRRLEQCEIGSRDYLVYSQGTIEDGGSGNVAVRDLRSGVTTHSTIVADDPTCDSETPGVYAIEKSLVADHVTLLDVPGLQERRILTAPSDTMALCESLDHRLIALDVTPRVSSLEEYPADSVGPLGQVR